MVVATVGNAMHFKDIAIWSRDMMHFERVVVLPDEIRLKFAVIIFNY